jgi:two-component system sensor histidine kinase YesM
MHGLSEKLNQNKQAVLLIDILDCADNVTISIFDNGCGISCNDKLMKPKDKGIGLGNVHERIRLIYGDQYGLTVESEKDKFTMVEIHIEKRFLKQTRERGNIHDSLVNC